MRSRGLLIVGIGAIAASLLLAVGGIGAGRMTGWSVGAPGAMMGPAFGGGNGDIRMDRAVRIAQDMAASFSGGSLAADEVIKFSDNYYASIRVKGTRIGAFEILIDAQPGTSSRSQGRT